MDVGTNTTTVASYANSTYSTYDITKNPGVVFYMTWQVTFSVMCVLTNLLTIITMRQPHFKKQPTTVFLLSLAVSDSVLAPQRVINAVGNILNKEFWALNIGLCR